MSIAKNRLRPRLFWILLLIACSTSERASGQGGPPASVVTEPIREQEFNDQIRLVGRCQAWIESRVVSEVSGVVARVNAEEGIYVERGEPLISIDTRRIALVVKAKAAAERQAELNSQLAEAGMQRIKELKERNLVSETRLDSAMAWAGIQSARHLQLEAELDQLKLELENCVIRALYSGFTGKRLVDVGSWVTAGTPVFETVDISRVRVYVDLPERYFGHVALGSEVALERTGDDLTFIGTVIGTSANASPQTHTFPVTIMIPNPDGLLAGGMLVRVTLTMKEKFTSFAVSKDAIVRQGSSTMIYTVVEGKAARIPVTLTATAGDYVAVSGDGLKPGMPVVIRGNERIFPGSPVMTGPPAEGESTEPEPEDPSGETGS